MPRLGKDLYKVRVPDARVVIVSCAARVEADPQDSTLFWFRLRHRHTSRKHQPRRCHGHTAFQKAATGHSVFAIQIFGH
ncbi:MAG: hypothetical protein EB015_22950 [Methylocystaceae bacterium]|nr:hypothetical protein [Methylocystaceae bacterium]